MIEEDDLESYWDEIRLAPLPTATMSVEDGTLPQVHAFFGKSAVFWLGLLDIDKHEITSRYIAVMTEDEVNANALKFEARFPAERNLEPHYIGLWANLEDDSPLLVGIHPLSEQFVTAGDMIQLNFQLLL